MDFVCNKCNSLKIKKKETTKILEFVRILKKERKIITGCLYFSPTERRRYFDSLNQKKVPDAIYATKKKSVDSEL